MVYLAKEDQEFVLLYQLRARTKVNTCSPPLPLTLLPFWLKKHAKIFKVVAVAACNVIHQVSFGMLVIFLLWPFFKLLQTVQQLLKFSKLFFIRIVVHSYSWQNTCYVALVRNFTESYLNYAWIYTVQAYYLEHGHLSCFLKSLPQAGCMIGIGGYFVKTKQIAAHEFLVVQ